MKITFNLHFILETHRKARFVGMLELEHLKQHAANIRANIIRGTYHAASGHPGGSLSIADIMTVLYFCELNVDPKNPKMEDRDRVVLSKGHTAPALYAT